MREGYRNEMFSSMIADVIDGNSGALFEVNRDEPEQQEQRIWELNSDEELPADPTEEEKEKKHAKNKKKYLRKKEKQQAEKAKHEQQKPESKDNISHSLAAMSIQDATPVPDDDRDLGKVNGDTAPHAPISQPKLSKRQKKTLLKKAKQAQNATPTADLTGSTVTSDSSSCFNSIKSKTTEHDESKKENKSGCDGHEVSEHDDEEKEVATESEVEAVMDTVAKRFGQ